jgi:hypothetical protein
MAFSILPCIFLERNVRFLLVDGSSHKVDLNFAVGDRRIVEMMKVCRGNK